MKDSKTTKLSSLMDCVLQPSAQNEHHHPKLIFFETLILQLSIIIVNLGYDGDKLRIFFERYILKPSFRLLTSIQGESELHFGY